MYEFKRYDSIIHNRQSIRLSGHDYSKKGFYSITLCTHNRKCLFGKIVNGKMQLNDGGRIAQQCWYEIPKHYPFVILDVYVIMPNHIHGIIIIHNNVHENDIMGMGHMVRANDYSPLREPSVPRRPNGTSRTIGSVIRGFKIGITKWFREKTDIFDVWQRNYYEHIVRDQQNLERIRQYIFDNPLNWKNDEWFELY